jgi:hypothetical protein
MLKLMFFFSILINEVKIFHLKMNQVALIHIFILQFFSSSNLIFTQFLKQSELINVKGPSGVKFYIIYFPLD